MWEMLKEYGKPIGLVILGVLGARMIESGASTVFNGAKNQIAKLSVGQSAENQAANQVTDTPATTVIAASGKPQPANAGEVNK